MLHVRSANLVEVAAGLPRESDRWDMGYQWISRFLANGLVCCDDVMAPFAREILAWLAESGEPIPLILDQTKASDHHQILMLSVRWGERALPLAWRVAETEGAIGFATQQELLEVVAGWLSVGGLSGISCGVGHDRSEGAHPCRDAKNLTSRMPCSINCWPAPIRELPWRPMGCLTI